MKKIIVLCSAMLCSSALFALNAPVSAVVVPQGLQHVKQQAGVSSVITVYDQFKKLAYEHQYHEYGILFAQLNKLREAYMALYEQQPHWAITISRRLVKLIEINHGEMEIRIDEYILTEMDNCMLEDVNSLTQEDQEKLEQFAHLLHRNAQIAEELVPAGR